MWDRAKTLNNSTSKVSVEIIEHWNIQEDTEEEIVHLEHPKVANFANHTKKVLYYTDKSVKKKDESLNSTQTQRVISPIKVLEREEENQNFNKSYVSNCSKTKPSE